jgi:glycerophosphoryl diester phosphodiesterase
MAKTEYFEGAGLRLLAHRGLWQHTGLLAENTLGAFAEALSFGATHIESDVHATKDGYAVLFHDDDLKRVIGLNRRISEMTLEEVQAIRLTNDEGIPLLRDALGEFPTARFNLDVKSTAAIAPTAYEVQNFQAHQRVLISSFSERRRRATLELIQKPVATSASATMAASALLAYRLGSATQLRAITQGVDALQVPASRAGFKFAEAGFVAAVSSLGLELHFWTINEPEQMRALISLGARGLVSDRIDLAVNLL